VAVIVAVVFYSGILFWTYRLKIAPDFTYLRYSYSPPSVYYYAASLVLAWIPAFVIPIKLQRPSLVVYWFLYVLCVIPSALIPLISVPGLGFRSVLLTGSVVLSFLLLGLIYFIDLSVVPIPRVPFPPNLFWLLFGLVFAGFNIALVLTFGIHVRPPPLSDVYGVRLQAREIVAEHGGYIGYILEWQQKVVNPFLIAYGLIRKAPLFLVIGVLGQLYLFSVEGAKGVYFSSAFLAILLVLCSQKRRKYFGRNVVQGAALLALLAIVGDVLFGGRLLTSLFVRRLMVTPGLLTGFYFDFFSHNPLAHLGHSILKPFVNYPYTSSPGFVIGTNYFANPLDSANANIWADGFANFGYAGMFVFTAIAGVFLLAFDSLSRGLDLRLTAVLLGLPAIALSNTALFTTFLTHGLLFDLLLVAILPKSFSKDMETSLGTTGDGLSSLSAKGVSAARIPGRGLGRQ